MHAHIHTYYVCDPIVIAALLNKLNVKIRSLEQQLQQPAAERAAQGAPVRRCSASGPAHNEMPTGK